MAICAQVRTRVWVRKEILGIRFYQSGKCNAEGSIQEQKSCLVTILHQGLTVPGLGLTSRELQSKCGLACLDGL